MEGGEGGQVEGGEGVREREVKGSWKEGGQGEGGDGVRERDMKGSWRGRGR